MAKTFDLVVFDWDGTLMDSAAAIVTAIQRSAQDLGLPEPSEERARHVIGLGLQDALRIAVPELAPADYDRMVERYRYYYLARDQELRLFAGIEALLDWLAAQEVFLAVATGKSRLGLERALRHSGLAPRFDATRCADECFSKPHPEMLESLMAEFDVAPERTLMIGDTTHDLQMARNAGVHGIGVTFGAHSRTQLESEPALAWVDSVEGLRKCLQGMF